ncbi:hypothetical protein JHK87_055466 [Glycine soja]|nr:hypothetical protein JHK87_055466 [Glycine soja]
MIANFKSMLIDMWDIVENGNHIPFDKELKEIPRNVDTLAITYERSSQVKRNKLSLLTHKHEFFTVEEGEDIQYMIGCFQTILNEFMSLGITFDNYDHIDKILGTLSRNWRPRVTKLRALKNLDTMSLEELVEALKVHKQ